MDALDTEELAEFEDVEATRDGGLALLCRVNGKDVWIPTRQIAVRGQVQKRGDRGILVIPRWLAISLRLLDDDPLGTEIPYRRRPRGILRRTQGKWDQRGSL